MVKLFLTQQLVHLPLKKVFSVNVIVKKFLHVQQTPNPEAQVPALVPPIKIYKNILVSSNNNKNYIRVVSYNALK